MGGEAWQALACLLPGLFQALDLTEPLQHGVVAYPDRSENYPGNGRT